MKEDVLHFTYIYYIYTLYPDSMANKSGYLSRKKGKEEPDGLHPIPPPHMKLHTKDVRGGERLFRIIAKWADSVQH